MIIRGNAIKYGDEVSTDLIYPGRYTYILMSEEEMGKHALEDLDPTFGSRDVCGCIIVAGNNWGCGSAREQAVKALKAKGIRIIIAKSIARIYYRNCINEGMLPIACPEAAAAIESGMDVAVDIENGIITAGEREFPFPKFPEFVLSSFACGGLIPSVKQEIAARKAR